MKKKVCVIIGTRPEAIKLCPVIDVIRKDNVFDCKICLTGQHREMVQQVFNLFGIVPDIDLSLMCPNQTLGALTSKAIKAIDDYLVKEKPDVVIVQGDTTTVLSGALSAFYHHIPIAHVEAGLRTWDMEHPWPEEANRVLTTRLAKWHFCPTENNKRNLLRENVDKQNIYVTGNTVIDTLLWAKDVISKNPPPIHGISPDLMSSDEKVILITGHRRENFGKGLEHICSSIYALSERFTDIHFIYPVHLNPNVRKPVERILGGCGNRNIHLIAPQAYLPFVALMQRAYLILTDSGGVQEEAPSLGKPVLVMRDTTERPEAVVAGAVKVVGTMPDVIVAETSRLIENECVYSGMSKVMNPYGDGHAAERIVEVLKSEL